MLAVIQHLVACVEPRLPSSETGPEALLPDRQTAG